MRIRLLLVFFIISNYIFAICPEDACGPYPGMPNYLCADGVTMAGPGDCVELPSGECAWEIITCSEVAVLGYLRAIEASFCMDACSQYSLESEIDAGFGQINLISLTDAYDLTSYLDRFVEVQIGGQFNCVECSAFQTEQISLSDDCQYPVDCFQDPCLTENCPAYPNAACVANYCGGCYADFYNANGVIIADCGTSTGCPGENPAGCFQNGCPDGYECEDAWDSNCVSSNCSCDVSTAQWMCTDDCNGGTCFEVNDACTDLSGLFFGPCAMYLGVGFSDDTCQHISGCGWNVDGVDYSNAFFDTMDECEEVCNIDSMTCDEISNTYESFHHSEEYIACEFDNDCVAVWGHCDIGLGGCHYSVNEENYMEEDINDLVDMWIDGDCMQWVCDCSSSPYAQCIDGACSSAYCMSDNPAGCFQAGCEDGYECIINPNECVPSWCGCDGFYGEWYCTEDCGGGTCVASFQTGDMNGDGFINVVDIVLSIQLILEGEYNPQGDMNGDSLLNVIDIVMMVNIVLNS